MHELREAGQVPCAAKGLVTEMARYGPVRSRVLYWPTRKRGCLQKNNVAMRKIMTPLEVLKKWNLSEPDTAFIILVVLGRMPITKAYRLAYRSNATSGLPSLASHRLSIFEFPARQLSEYFQRNQIPPMPKFDMALNKRK